MSYRSFSRPLLQWYARAQRPLPWRRTRDPYRIWISETLLQQTTVTTVIPYYRNFLARFPNVRKLATASLDAVLKAWEGAGYYARARNLRRAAQMIVTDFGGRLPRTVDELLTLPGVGRYTAGAIASIAFNRTEPVLDGNVERVLARYFAIRTEVKQKATREKLWHLARAVIPSGQARAFNQAMMDLGATLCRPRRPLCAQCPVRRTCQARRLGVQDELPVRAKKKPTPHYDIAVGVVWKRGKILIDQRKAEGLLGGLWEFPGGKKERGESLEDAAVREVKEELGVQVRVRAGGEFARIQHAYSHFSVTLHVYACDWVSGRPSAIDCAQWKWVRPDELAGYPFPTANRKIIARLLARV